MHKQKHCPKTNFTMLYATYEYFWHQSHKALFTVKEELNKISEIYWKTEGFKINQKGRNISERIKHQT